MDYDRFTEKFPIEVKAHLDTVLAESGLPKTDPLVSMLLMQIHISEVIERRRRRALCAAALVICLLVAVLGWNIGNSNHFQKMGNAIRIDTGIRKPKDAWVYQDGLYVTYK